MKKIIAIVVLTMMYYSVDAAGFRVALQSAKQTGMAHVGAGMSLDQESIFFNPGAVVFGDGGISFTGSGVISTTTFNIPGTSYTTELEDNIGTPVALYASKKFNDKLAGGIGVYTPYGNRVEWPADWAGRAVSQSIDLKTFFIQPTLSYKVSDKVGIGAGFIYATGSVELQRGVPNLVNQNGIETDVTLETDGGASGVGYNLGIFIEPNEEFSFGINYRSKIEVDAEDGNVIIDNLPQAAAGIFNATSFNATLPLPAELAFGVAFTPNDRLTLAMDANVISWSQYETLSFEYDGVLGGSSNTVVPQNWEDAWTIKLGGQYAASDKFDVRGGMYLDFTPIPDETLSPITPDADRFNVSFGGTYKPNDKFSVDGALLFVNGQEREVSASENQFNFAQRYKVGATVPSLGLNYSFNN